MRREGESCGFEWTQQSPAKRGLWWFATMFIVVENVRKASDEQDEEIITGACHTPYHLWCPCRDILRHAVHGLWGFQYVLSLNRTPDQNYEYRLSPKHRQP